MIRLDTDLHLICNMINVSYKKITEQYAGMSIDDILEAEAAQGNAAAANFDKEIFNDPAKLAEVFGLDNVRNRYAILSNLSERDLEKLLPLLPKEDLIMGLKFFDKEKLLKLLGQLPKDQLVKYVLEMFPPKRILELMPKEFIDKFLMSDNLDKSLVLKHLKALPPEILAQMLESVTGKPVENMDKLDMIKQISLLSPQKYKDALISIPEENKRMFILQMVKEKPKLLEMFDADGYVKILGTKEKPDLIKAAVSIEPDELVKMLKELPQELLAIVMTQIDPKVFADVLIQDYQDVLKQVVAV